MPAVFCVAAFPTRCPSHLTSHTVIGSHLCGRWVWEWCGAMLALGNARLWGNALPQTKQQQRDCYVKKPQFYRCFLPGCKAAPNPAKGPMLKVSLSSVSTGPPCLTCWTLDLREKAEGAGPRPAPGRGTGKADRVLQCCRARMTDAQPCPPQRNHLAHTILLHERCCMATLQRCGGSAPDSTHSPRLRAHCEHE